MTQTSPSEDTTTPTPDSEELHRLEAQRLENREQIRSLGMDPYGSSVQGPQTLGSLVSLDAARSRYSESADQAHQEHGKEDGFVDERPVVHTAGRVVLRRPSGKLVWMNLRDASGEIQIAVSKADCDEQGFALAKTCDLADVLVVEGPLMKTRKGEITIWASSVRPASKCVVPPPEKWSGLQDVEARYRQRYVDLWANPESMRTLSLRSKLISRMREVMASRGYLEVETPMLQSLAGGAAARPFITHMNALDVDLFMRVAPELYLKRLLVGGMPKVFEINRNFRNEGVDKQHNPEFTVIEAYEAFGDYHTVMDLSETLLRECARVAAAETGGDPSSMSFGELAIDYERPFDRVTYAQLFERALGFAPTDHARALEAAQQHHIKTRDEKGQELDPVWVVNELFEEVAEPTIDPARPTWVMDYPAALSPLTRSKIGSPEIAERADLFVGGMELGPHYTELNDPDIQLAKFREQLAGIDDEESTFRTLDQDFVRALKVGMPPAGGMGLGIDRIAMLMTNSPTIRDVILFPLLRPE